MQGFFVIYFSSIALQILRRKRQRLNLIFSGFFINIIIGNLLNMIYAPIPLHLETIIMILHFLTVFFIFFGIIFILIVNMVILESTLVFSVKRQNMYILLYGCILFLGMLILVIIGMIFDDYENPLFGVVIDDKGYPRWGPIFFVYVIFITSAFAIIPIISTNWKIYHSFETKALKKKWLFYLIGSLGIFSIGYTISTSNLLGDELFRLIVSIFGISIIIWGSLMYYGIGSKLKE